ncbi:Cna B-type domain-containing protein, partial [uncultured Methanobrevibacter sp.]|uniref:Cna B-type domain-containing protein n=1 Tax=uncultured Methanobrevibacter sp. TaxID=253161 RepID=UPI0025DBA4DC
ISNDSAYSFTVTNTHVPVVTSVDVIKVWNDINNQDGVRPAGVTVVLSGNGNVVGTVTLDDSNAWKHTFENLPVFSNGTVIKYSIEELDVANYSVVISNDSAYSFTVTNTHVPVVTSVDVIKVWNDINKRWC